MVPKRCRKFPKLPPDMQWWFELFLNQDKEDINTHTHTRTISKFKQSMGRIPPTLKATLTDF